jgi:hypothetical protein
MSRLSELERRTVSTIVELVIPDFPRLEATVRARVLDDACRYVLDQIGAMAGFLAGPYRVAILAFAVMPVLRYGKVFHTLSRPRQHASLSLWSAARIGAMRDFVKLIRSCALLAYFDHDDVRRVLEAEAAAPESPSAASRTAR